MCQHKSGVAVKDGETIKVYTLVGEDSHTKIRNVHKLRDGGGAGAIFQTPVELVPVGQADLSAPETWNFNFDDHRPAWWTDEMTAEAISQLAAAEKLDWKDGVLTAGGALDLSSLTALPATAKLTAGGDLYLSSLTALPAKGQVQCKRFYCCGQWHAGS